MSDQSSVIVGADSLVFEVDKDGSIHMFFPNGVDPQNVHPVWTFVSYLLSQKMQDQNWVDELSREMRQWTPPQTETAH